MTGTSPEDTSPGRPHPTRDLSPAGDPADNAPATDGGGETAWHKAKPIDGLSWRIAVRQADTLIRRAQAQAAIDHSLKNKRLTTRGTILTEAFEALADEVWNALRIPPGNVGEAYALDDRLEANWPKDKPMKASELQAGKTYVGKGGRRRFIVRTINGYDGVPWDVIYFHDGREGHCLAYTFARWALREATPEESAP